MQTISRRFAEFALAALFTTVLAAARAAHAQVADRDARNGNLIAYAESPDGLSWSSSTVLYNFSNDPNQPGFYVTPIGLGEELHVLGKQSYIMYSYYPNNGEGWSGASVRRFTVTCQ
jgi:hypothetical protein